MTNPLTMQVESRLGAAFVALMALFLSSILFIAIKNYSSDQIVLNATATEIRSMSSTERQIIAAWVNENDIVIPENKGYRYLLQKYPDRPWLKY